MKKLVIVGAGFAGFWAAMSAARKMQKNNHQETIDITVINKEDYHTIRPRLYEASLQGITVPLNKYFDPLNIKLVIGEVVDINIEEATVSLLGNDTKIAYDALIMATGSRLKKPNLSGVDNAFNVDTLQAARELDSHLGQLGESGFSDKAACHFVVVGGGFTGIEIATSLPERLKKLSNDRINYQLSLVDQGTDIALNYSAEGRDYILNKIKQYGIELILNDSIECIESERLFLRSGKIIDTKTVILASGFQANSLTTDLPFHKDDMGRMETNSYLQSTMVPSIFVAGDLAKVKVDQENFALMSCQHAMAQGKQVGGNAVNYLFDESMSAYAQPNYVTCLDLGENDALFTMGWDRQVQKTGNEAKSLKSQIVQQWIYPADDVEKTLLMSDPEFG